MVLSLVEKYEDLIRTEARKVYLQESPGLGCEIEDVEQHVLMILWERRESLDRALATVSFIRRAARSEARRAIAQMCREYRQLRLVLISDHPEVGEMCYSSDAALAEHPG